MESLTLRPLRRGDVQTIVSAFAAIGWNKPASQYERYLEEQTRGERAVIVAFWREEFTGYLTICWQSSYPPFLDEGIPEIVDLNVLPQMRRQGFGSRLMEEAERQIAERSKVAGIGVGLYADYGAAQRLYVKRGYVPDGRGLISHQRPVAAGESVIVDDGLELCFTKRLHPQA